ncbi:type II toxin-antitoxin system MazE family antitoxin [Myxosarcina sp. GI1(2024)]
MSQKISITLDKNAIEFIDSQTKNRSQFINSLILRAQKEKRLKELERAYIEQANDKDEATEILLWDCTAGDGLSDDD